MIRPLSATPPVVVTVLPINRLAERRKALENFALDVTPAPLGRHPGWLEVLHRGLGHDVYALEATAGGFTCGYLPLAHVESLLFGRFLVSLPYLNSNGVFAASAEVQSLLVTRACELADELGVRYLELRHETPSDHPSLNGRLTSKVHMRLALPDSPEELWKGFDPKVRNQVRKGEKHGFSVSWGGESELEAFHAVLARNMRDLGTPVFGKTLFFEILNTFPDNAELCVLRQGDAPVAAALLIHGDGITEVPTASSLREVNSTCANMLMYRHLLDRAVDREQSVFDFGRSTLDGPTFKFKQQWGAQPHPAHWQYYIREGSVGEMRPDNPRYQRIIRLWQKLPVSVTSFLGPGIVRGIP